MSDKYPRTLHLPWSPCSTADDKRMKTARSLVGPRVVITEKLDGGNVCLTGTAVHARTHSPTAKTHPSLDWLKSFHANFKEKLPPGLSLFCEYTYAVHNLVYEGLPSYLWVIGVRKDDSALWLSWSETTNLAATWGLPTVPVLVEGAFASEAKLQAEVEKQAKSVGFFGRREGVVVRKADGFNSAEFSTSVGKDVRIKAPDTCKRPHEVLVSRQALAEASD